MYRFLLRPKWLAFHLLCLAVIVAMVSLGLWQLRRLDEKREFNDRVRSTTNEPVAPLTDVMEELRGAGGLEDVEYRRVEITATYEARQFEIVNVSQDGVSGHDQVAAVELHDGTMVIVNRGFAPGAQALPQLPMGEVTIIGRLRQSKRAGTGQTADDGSQELTEIRRVDLEVLAQQFDQPLQPLYIELLTEDGETPAGLTPIAFPSLGEGPHMGYAVQWFIFSISVAAGWVLAVRRSAHEPGDRPAKRKKALIPEQYLDG
jgi:cytochrome oxidase assembly protein ShyY1